MSAFDAGAVEVKVGANFDPSGFDRYERAIRQAKTHAERDIDATLSAKAHTEPITRYERAVDGAQRKAHEGATAKLDASADTRQIDRYNHAIDTTERNAKTATAAHSKLAGSMGMIGGAAMVSGFAAAGAASALMARRVVMGASDVNESITKNQTVFGKWAEDVRTFSKSAAESYGISDKAAMAYTGTFGNLMVSLGSGKKQASENSVAMTKLAADMASFNNTSIDQALEAIRSGLVGEVEPLRQFGVSLQDAQLRQEAMKLGLTDSVKNVLTPYQRMMAAQALIVKQSATAHGDFHRTSGGLANQLRILSAEVSNAGDSLGRKLLPYVVQGVTFVNDLISGKGGTGGVKGVITWLGRLPGAIAAINPQGFAKIGTEFGVAVGLVERYANGLIRILSNTFGGDTGFGADVRKIAHVLIDILGGAFSAVESIAKRALPGVLTVFRGLAETIRGVVRIIAGILTLDFGKVMDGLADTTRGSLKLIGGALRAGSAPLRAAAAFLWGGISDAFDFVLDKVLGGVTSMLGIVSKMASVAKFLHLPGAAQAKDAIDDLRKSLDHYRESLRDTQSQHGKVSVKHLVSEVASARRELDRAKDGSDDARKADEKLTKAKDKLADRLRDTKNPAKTASNAIRSVGSSAKAAAGDVASALGSIGANTNEVLGGMGAPKLHFTIHKTALGGGSAAGDSPFSAFATGGWIGSRGEAGHDSVRVNARPGDAILNRHHLPYVDEALGAFGMSLDSLLRRGAAGGGTVPILAARGEAHVPAASTGIIDAALSAYFGGGLGDLFAAVQRPHYMAGGGLLSGELNEPALDRALLAMAQATHRAIFVQDGARTMAEQEAQVRAKGIYNAQTNPHGAAPASPSAPHVMGVAADITPGREVFGGVAGKYGLTFNVPTESWHIALSGGATGGGATGGGGGSAAAPVEHLARRIVGGPKGTLRTAMQGSVDKAVTAANKAIDRAAPDAGAGGGGGGGNAANQSLAHRMMLRIWGEQEWPPLRNLWNRESGFSTTATNPTSGAYGIPQSNPAGKMASAGRDWLTNPRTQIKWGLGYIRNRYGTPTAAWGHSEATGWYGRGGFLRRFAPGGIVGGGATASAASAAKPATHFSTLVHRMSTGRSRYAKITHDIDLSETKYAQTERRANISTEDFVKADGTLDEAAIAQRVGEIDSLVHLREHIRTLWKNARAEARRVRDVLDAIIARLRKAMAAAKGKKKAKTRQGYAERISTYTEARKGFATDIEDITLKSLPDNLLDLDELRHERAGVKGTKAEPQDAPDAATPADTTDTSAASAASAAGDTTTTTETTAAPPTPAEIAEAARVQVEAFNAARSDLFQSFGSNFTTAAVQSNPDVAAAGARFFGAMTAGQTEGSTGDGATIGDGRTVTVVNNFAAPPPDPHTWSAGTEFELNAL